MGTTKGEKALNKSNNKQNVLHSEANFLKEGKGGRKKKGTQPPEKFRNKRCFVVDRAIYKLGYKIKLLFYSRKKENELVFTPNNFLSSQCARCCPVGSN